MLVSARTCLRNLPCDYVDLAQFRYFVPKSLNFFDILTDTNSINNLLKMKITIIKPQALGSGAKIHRHNLCESFIKIL